MSAHRLDPRHPATEYVASLGQMYDVDHLRALTAQALERGEVDEMRWPTLVREMNIHVFAAPTVATTGGGGPGS